MRRRCSQATKEGWITKNLANLINGSYIKISFNQRAELVYCCRFAVQGVRIRIHKTESARNLSPLLEDFWLATVDRARSVHARLHGGLG